MQNKILIGTGFYSTAENHWQRKNFFRRWWLNTWRTSERVVVVDNSEVGFTFPEIQIIRVHNNLGPNTDVGPTHSRLLGWSMSWIIPAMIAYSEQCDFVYKEQDCLAFGDWLPEICHANISVGRNSQMPCEQSLFYLKRDFIPTFVAQYIADPARDNEVMTECKMFEAAKGYMNTRFFDMPFGRERPLTFYSDRPWYAQRWTDDELAELDKHPEIQ